ncbi:hypothetical protein JJP59_24170, partial [Enterobacter hormaechei]|nr:hypothetical protein [Enterobacter hormaechei]
MAWLDFVNLINDKQKPLLVASHNLPVEAFIHREGSIIGFDNPQDE